MPKTYNDLYIGVRNTLRENGVEAAGVEARLIVATAAGKTTEKLLRDLRLYVAEDMEERVAAMLARRLRGEPVAYITGVWEFMGLPMEVSRDVLIPRSDTEVLAQAAIDALTGRAQDGRVLDLCSGSGCIGCAIAAALPQARVVLADISPEAMALAKRNVEHNRLQGRVSFMAVDVMREPPIMTGSFDLLVSNPPYIPTVDILTLDPSVRDYEPVWALDGGEDGLDFYRAILRNWKSVIRPGGRLMFEVGEEQADTVKDLLLFSGFHDVLLTEDTRGVQRVVSARL
ncbi:MAG: peptide chain release factor N(5)-glutamine methyltransferase [Oscillospiraceae bacterium]